MAISPVRVVTDIEATDVTSFVFNVGTAATDGNLLVACISTDNDAVLTPPAGWVEEFTFLRGTSLRNSVFVKEAGAGEPTSYTWTLSSAQTCAGAIAELNGANNAVPIDGTPAQNNGSSTTPSSPSIVTGINGSLVFSFVSIQNFATLSIIDAALTNTWNVSSGAADATGAAGGSVIQATAGATPTFSHTISGGSQQWIGTTFAIAPAAAGSSIPVFMNHYSRMMRG